MAEYARADYGVPHVNFQRTENGFTVSYKKTGLGFHRSQLSISNSSKKGGGAAIGALLGFLVLGVIWVFWAILSRGTKIEVTQDAVIVDGKKMSRDDFGGFSVQSTWKSPDKEHTLAVLGYSFGHRGFPFGGAWEEGQATEVANALNIHLRKTPVAGDEANASPEMLRAARPTDF